MVLEDDAVLDELRSGYTSVFQKSGPVRLLHRSANPLPVQNGCVRPIGSYFQLEEYEPLLRQLLRSLKKMEANFVPIYQFERHLQLFRLVAAPGMGKVGRSEIVCYLCSAKHDVCHFVCACCVLCVVHALASSYVLTMGMCSGFQTTALFEIWRLLPRMAMSELDGDNTVEASLLERIRSSLAEGCMMVFLLDLSETGELTLRHRLVFAKPENPVTNAVPLD